MDEAERLLDEISRETENAGTDFFVGAGSSRLAQNYKVPESYADQLMEKSEGVEIPVQDDLATFEVEKIEITSDETYRILFLSGKKKAYNLFDYLSIKSMHMGGAPRKEEDLILNEDDFQVINELKILTKDYFAVYSLAIMYTYLEMGIGEVQFKQKDNCPLCKALDGSISDLYNTINLVCAGNGITHRYCDGEFLPVIRREQSYGVLDSKLNTTLEDGKNIINLPVEMKDKLLGHIEKLPNDIVEFLNIREYMANNNVDDSSGTVVIEDEEDILFVHNSYVGNLGPVDFLEAFRRDEKHLPKVDLRELAGREVLYYKGKKVVELNGKYWSPESGEEVKDI